MEAKEFGTATNHAPTISRAREVLLDELVGKFTRESRVNLELFVDYMMRREYFSNKFYAAYSNAVEEEES